MAYRETGHMQVGKGALAASRKQEKQKQAERRASDSDLRAMDFAVDPHDIALEAYPTEPRHRTITDESQALSRLQPNSQGRSSTSPLFSNTFDNQSVNASPGPSTIASTHLHPVLSHRREVSIDPLQEENDYLQAGLGAGLSRPISRTDCPLPNQSQYSLHRQPTNPNTHNALSRTRTRSRIQNLINTTSDPAHHLSGHDLHPLKTFRSLLPHGLETDEYHNAPKKPQHSRRPAPLWMGLLPFPIFTIWGFTSALIMGTIIGFTLSAVYNTAGFEMST